MPDRELPARPNLEQYKKQAKDLARDGSLGLPEAVTRVKRHHPQPDKGVVSRTDAQLVIAREHGFESWPKFANYIETLHLIESVAAITDPVAAFIEVACAPRHSGHNSGTLDHAEMILARYPRVATRDIYTASILGDEPGVRGFLSRDPKCAAAKGGPHGWDALTYLCFSRYLRIDKSRSEKFVASARALLDAGASANTGWIEMIDHPKPRPIIESALYGAAGVAQNAGLTKLLIERGADPNDEETPYHVPESYDNTVMQIVLESGKLDQGNLALMLARKCDWHDEAGVRLVLAYGADPNFQRRFGAAPLHHALRRDNSLSIIETLLDHGGDPAVRNIHDGRSALSVAARRGRADVLRMLEQRGIPIQARGVELLIAFCAKGDREVIRSLAEAEPRLTQQLIAEGGTLLTEFAGNGNVEGLRCLLDLGVSAGALYPEGDGYWDLAKNGTALHAAAWRARPASVEELIKRGTPVNVMDAKGRTALALAMKACVDSYWTDRRSPDSVAALLSAGATVEGIDFPSGYDEVDDLLRSHMK